MSLWTNPENTFLNSVSLSINMVFCISAAVLITTSNFASSLVNSFIVFFIPSPRALIITGTIVTVCPGLLSHLKSKLSISLCLRFVSWYCCMGHAMSQIQICFAYLVLSIKSGLLVLLVFHRLNWKSQTSFAWSFSKTIPHFHHSLYHTVSAPINLCSFVQVTASIISALLRLPKYSLLDKTVQTASRCFTVSSCPWHTWQLPSSTSIGPPSKMSFSPSVSALTW